MNTNKTYKYKIKKVNKKINRTFQESFLYRKDKTLNRRPFKISAIYFVFGVLWILLSDRVVHIISRDTDMETLLQTIKGWVFVIATTLLIFSMLAKLFSEIKKLFDELIESYQEKESVEEELRQNYNELKNKDKLLVESNERYDLALECSNDIIWEWDVASDRLIFSRRINDYVDNDLINEKAGNFINLVINEQDREMALKDIKNHIKGDNDFYKSVYRILNKNGQYIWVLSTGKAVRDTNGKVVRMLGSIKDINDSKSYEESLYKMAFYDSLTALSNRKFFIKELGKLIEEKRNCSILYIDVDDFKKVNDVMGHDFGDQVLIFVSKLLSSAVGEDNLVSRTGGDEFAVLLECTNCREDIVELCDRLISQFRLPLFVDEKSIYTSLSIGISIYPDDGEDVNTLIKKSDIAMYKSKGKGKNCYSFFDREMSDELIRKADIEKYLRCAAYDEEFDIYYQPQINITTNELTGFEALLRWTNKRLGSVPPSEFIPVAEETGLIEKIGEWVIKRVCADCRDWTEKGYDFQKLSINISVKQLQNKEFLSSVSEIIKEKGIKPNCLIFEITESVIMDNFSSNIKVINAFLDMGIQIALDDFGTGNSSINYLRKLPIGILKIDKSFIDNIESSMIDKVIIKELIQLSDDLGIDVIVEGIEKREQVEILRDIGCSKIQGYYFSRPLTVKKAEEILKSGMEFF